MKRIAFIILFTLFIYSCVARSPYRFAVYWQSVRQQMNNPMIGKSYWVKKDFIYASKEPLKKAKIKIPKFSKLVYSRLGSFSRYVNKEIKHFSLIEYKLVKVSPLKSGIYKNNENLPKKGRLYYIAFPEKGNKIKELFKNDFFDYNPITAFDLSEEELEAIAQKKVNTGDREVLLLLAFGKPQKTVKEKIRGRIFRRYFYGKRGYYYVFNKRIRIKSDIPYHID